MAGTIFYTKSKFLGGVHGYNVCPVVYKGTICHKLYKTDDDGTIGHAIQGAKHTKKATLPYFEVEKIAFGIDICLDHDNGVLFNYLQKSGKAAPDIHIVVSATTGVQNSSVAAREGGYLLHCDLSSKKKSSVYAVGARTYAGHLDKEGSVAKTAVGPDTTRNLNTDGDLLCYRLTLS